jgi:hypothetical protein
VCIVALCRLHLNQFNFKDAGGGLVPRSCPDVATAAELSICVRKRTHETMLSIFAAASGYTLHGATPNVIVARSNSPYALRMAETPLSAGSSPAGEPSQPVPVVPVPEGGSSADLSLPPESFLKLIEDAVAAAQLAMDDGCLLMEIEFPPLPTSKLEDTALSAYDILGANLGFAVEFAKRLKPIPNGGPRQIALTLADSAERTRASEYYGDDEPRAGLRLWSLNGGDEKAEEFSPMALFGALFKQGTGEVTPAPWADMHLIIGASAQELPAIQRLAELEPTKPIICFNLKLDTLRGDLGLPAFPGKDVHHDFLCQVKPVYYIRPRSYSLSLSVPPFLVAYSGVLYRRYPEPFQTLLDRGKGSYRRVQTMELRPALGTFKSQLTSALKLADEKARASAISSAGFKQSTWWEDDKEGKDVSKEWRL